MKRVLMKRIGLIFIGIVCAAGVVAQRAESYTISGYVTDAASGERLIGATVYDTVSHQGTVTNTAGFYTLTVKNEKTLKAPLSPPMEGGRTGVVLIASYVGYEPSAISIQPSEVSSQPSEVSSQPSAISIQPSEVSSQTINFELKLATQLQEVTVQGHQSVSAPENVQMSAIEVPVTQILAIPAIGGEVDVLKAIQLLPGVQSGGEGSAGLYVRGGGPDENLVMLDGAPLYNINHALGMFSVFNADAIKNVTLYKGNFPARFGSRLSSVIDVWQKDGNNTFWHGGITVGLIASKINLEGPIFSKAQLDSLKEGHSPRAKTTFNISARRTYFDLLTSPIIATVAATEGMSLWAGYYFYDINAKLSHTFSDRDRLSVGIYSGSDVEYLRMRQRDVYTGSRAEMQMGMRYGWGNTLATIDWQHKINHQLFLNTRVFYSGYRSRLSQSMSEKNTEETGSSFEQEMGYNSQINDVSVSSKLEYTPNQKHKVQAGIEYIFHHFQPSIQNTMFYSSGDSASGAFNMDTTIGNRALYGHEVAAYIEDTWSPVGWFRLNYGARFSMYGIRGKVYPSAEPRIGMRFLVHKDVAIKASYSYMSQYVHLLSNSSLSLPSDMWVPVTHDVPPMRSMQVAAGISYNILGQVELSVEGYYKRSLNLIEYKEGASYVGYSSDWQSKVAIGNGWSYGVEFLAQRKIGPVTGWIGYTWSRTMRQFDEINYGKPFHAKYDREHDLSITLQYQITPRIDIAGTWVYATGNRGTLVTQTYYDDTMKRYVEYFSERNGYVLPDYHRLDLSANFHFPHKRSEQGKKGKADGYYGKGGWLRHAEHVLNISCYNVYCHMNPMFVELDPYSGKLYQISMFPILPSISYMFKF